ncbi:hypothetical protein [Aliihoeflea sp. PC F10.4]
MNRILLASALVLGISGAAMAQQAPHTIGNFSASVEQALNPQQKIERPAGERSVNGNVDRTTTASINTTRSDEQPVGNVSIPLERTR